MIRKDQAAEARTAFTGELRALHKRCGKPPYKRLSAVSENLSEFYPPPEDGYRFVLLSPTAISEILTGKRTQPPKWGWVASFVLSCQRCAHIDGAATSDPGTASLPEWARRWSAAHDAAEAGAGGDQPPRAGPGTPRKCAVRLTPHQREFLASHGAYGRALTGQAQSGDPGAVYDAALLLGTDPAHRDDAVTLLIEAAATGHRPSASLLDDSPGHLPAFAAACLARAHSAEAGGHHDQAHAFRHAAARGRTARGRTAVDQAPAQDPGTEVRPD